MASCTAEVSEIFIKVGIRTTWTEGQTIANPLSSQENRKISTHI
jgi:hypothetical protein